MNVDLHIRSVSLLNCTLHFEALLKGQSHEIFTSGFCRQTILLGPLVH
jgi:hypothetical protein